MEVTNSEKERKTLEDPSTTEQLLNGLYTKVYNNFTCARTRA